MEISWKKYTLQFKRAAGTSRGVLKTKDSYFLKLEEGCHIGFGECGLLRGLSADDRPDYEVKLNWLVENAHKPFAELMGDLMEFPSIQFGLEIATKDLFSQNHILFPSSFTDGRSGQAINGLIWMGDREFMYQQVRERIEKGFRVLKMKIGAIDFDEELEILRYIRSQFKASDLELRVDANGAFEPGKALPVLEKLASLDIHSIEQPIAKGQWQEMAELCESSPLPIALDEELIGLFDKSEREKLLQCIKPQYIILKPSFIGGFRGSEEWISLAADHDCGWWVTSALESNLGLNAIAQWNFTQGNKMPSGLGTGSLYTNNIPAPLLIEKGQIFYDPDRSWDLNALAL